MPQTLITYSSNSGAYRRWLEAGKPDERPSDVPFAVPDAARKGDRYLIFVGGVDQTFVGCGTVETNWRIGGGGWEGHELVRCLDRFFREPRPADHIHAATGFRPPRREMVVPEDLAALVWRAATGKSYSPVDRAVEGILTESRSRSRDPGLRLAAIQRAAGRCECCGVDFRRRAGGLGVRCLVVHHKKQLKDTDTPRESKLSELAVVCANCHMMIHSNTAKALTVARLKSLLGK